MRYVQSIMVLASAISLAGCGQWGGTFSTAPRGGIAVVDLDKVAAETGRDRQLAQSLEMRQNSLNQSYAKTVESAKTQLDAKMKEYGEDLTDSEKKEFSQIQQNAISKLTQIQNKVRADFETYKQQQIAQFRSELKPIAHEIAAKRGLSIVIPKNEGLLLSVDPGVDITDEVIKMLRERHPVGSGDTESATANAPKPVATASQRGPSSAKSAAPSRAARQDDDEEAFR